MFGNGRYSHSPDTSVTSFSCSASLSSTSSGAPAVGTTFEPTSPFLFALLSSKCASSTTNPWLKALVNWKSKAHRRDHRDLVVGPAAPQEEHHLVDQPRDVLAEERDHAGAQVHVPARAPFIPQHLPRDVAGHHFEVGERHNLDGDDHQVQVRKWSPR